MSFRKPCRLLFRKLIPPFTLTARKQYAIFNVKILKGAKKTSQTSSYQC